MHTDCTTRIHCGCVEVGDSGKWWHIKTREGDLCSTTKGRVDLSAMRDSISLWNPTHKGSLDQGCVTLQSARHRRRAMFRIPNEPNCTRCQCPMAA